MNWTHINDATLYATTPCERKLRITTEKKGCVLSVLSSTEGWAELGSRPIKGHQSEEAREDLQEVADFLFPTPKPEVSKELRWSSINCSLYAEGPQGQRLRIKDHKNSDLQVCTVTLHILGENGIWTQLDTAFVRTGSGDRARDKPSCTTYGEAVSILKDLADKLFV